MHASAVVERNDFQPRVAGDRISQRTGGRVRHEHADFHGLRWSLAKRYAEPGSQQYWKDEDPEHRLGLAPELEEANHHQADERTLAESATLANGRRRRGGRAHASSR